MILYRAFRNDDPPALLDLYNACAEGRGWGAVRDTTGLERHVFSKPYFASGDLILAEADGRPVGFCLCGPGPNEGRSGVDRRVGVVAMVAVRPDFRRRGVGTELLNRAETRLRHLGARTLYAGPLPPNNPYGFSLYGGADTPGFLATDEAAGPFLLANGYLGTGTVLVMQRRLDRPLNVADPRFGVLKRRYELLPPHPARPASFWQEAVIGWVDPREYMLIDKLTGVPAARCLGWEMDNYGRRWRAVAVGLLDLQVRPDLQRLGLGKYLLTRILKALQEELIGLVETQVPERNGAAVNLCKSVGFEPVDSGRAYRKDEVGDTSMLSREEMSRGGGESDAASQ